MVEKRREQRSRVGNGNHGRSLNHRERRLLYGQGTCRPIWEEPARLPSGLKSLDTRVGLIQASIPLGLLAVEAVLQREVELLAGPRYARKDGAPNRVRWRRQRGSVYLLDHKVPVQVPRMRGRRLGVEVPLESYRRLQLPREAEEGMLRLSCRDYRAAAEAVPEAFGLPHSSASRRYIQRAAS